MEILDSIIINNIRRFGSNVTIEVGPGATIFYAPNGTGKTSVFESIELALTGKVKRLDNDFKPLIRDQSTDSSVRLNFMSGNYCQAQLKHGGKPVLTGNYDNLFANTPRENIPYLLRLTHLLNQSADGWFVQSRNTSDAGAQLDYLSIGREATQAKALMTGAKSAATDIKSKNQKELADAKDALEKWLTLVNKRNNSLNLEPTRPLISHEKLFSSINNIARDFGYNKLSFKSDIFLIKNQCHEVLALLSQNNEDTSTRLIELNGAKPLVTEYISISKQTTERRQSIILQSDTKTRIEYTIKELNIELLNEEKKFNIYTISHKRTKDKLDVISRAVELESNILALTAHIDSYIIQINEANNAYELAKQAYLDASEAHNKHQLLFARGKALAEINSLLTIQQAAITKWRELENNISQLITELRPGLLIEYTKDSEYLKTLTDQRNEQLTVLAEAQRVFDTINTANDAIVSAVGIVISKISIQTGVCPVCTQQYEPSELHRRMTDALNAISPELQHAASKLDEARDKLSRIDKRLFAANSKLVKSNSLLGNVDNSIVGLQAELSHIIDNTFPGIESVDTADEQYHQAVTENAVAIQELEQEKALISTPPSAENLAIVQNSMDSVSFVLSTMAEKMHSLERTRDKALEDSNDEFVTTSREEFEEVLREVEDEVTIIKNIEHSIELLRKEIEQQSRLLENKSLEIASLNRQLLEFNANINRYKTQWSLLKLLIAVS